MEREAASELRPGNPWIAAVPGPFGLYLALRERAGFAVVQPAWIQLALLRFDSLPVQPRWPLERWKQPEQPRKRERSLEPTSPMGNARPKNYLAAS
jgi:hypothetical protein